MKQRPEFISNERRETYMIEFLHSLKEFFFKAYFIFILITGSFFSHEPPKPDICFSMETLKDDHGNAAYYFGNRENGYDHDLYCAALRISLNERLTNTELTSIKDKVNKEGRDGQTLLKFAILPPVPNVDAVDQLLGIGADAKQEWQPKKTNSDTESMFVIIKPGDLSFIARVADSPEPSSARLMAFFLKHGGDPNLNFGVHGPLLIERVAIAGNFESFKLLLDHGADVWMDSNTENYFSNKSTEYEDKHPFEHDYLNTGIHQAALTAINNNDFSMINYYVDNGFLKKQNSARIMHLIRWLTIFGPADDNFSRWVYKTVRRIIAETNYPGDQRSREILAYGKVHGWE